MGLYFSACVDGSDFIHVQGDQTWVVHRNHAPLGQNGNCGGFPTTIELTSPLPSGPVEIVLDKTDIRNFVDITQFPTAENGWELVILVNDDPTPGPYNYQFGVEWTSLEPEWELWEEPEEQVGMWNEKYQIFNDSIIQESAGSPRWANTRIASETSEVRKKFRSRPLWQLDLSGLQLSADQYDELLAFQWINEGMLREFLCRNARQYLFENAKGRPSLCGMTDGVNRTFQLRKERKNQGRTRYEKIKFPNWFYPPLLDSNGRPWIIMPQTEIYVGGDGLGINKGALVSSIDTFQMDRNTGSFLLDQPYGPGLRVDAYGGYFTLMVCNEDEIPVKLVGSSYKISSGVKFTEPVVEEDDEDNDNNEEEPS